MLDYRELARVETSDDILSGVEWLMKPIQVIVDRSVELNIRAAKNNRH